MACYISVKDPERTRLPPLWDFIEEYGDDDFIKAVYVAIIGREPSPDDLKFRMEELKTKKFREELFLDVFNAEEHKMGPLHEVSGILKSDKRGAI